MECELVAQREQMAAKQREHMEEKEKLKRLKVLYGTFIWNFFLYFGEFFLFFSYILYSALLQLPPLRFRCADGCWDRTQDRCNLCIGSQTL